LPTPVTTLTQGFPDGVPDRSGTFCHGTHPVLALAEVAGTMIAAPATATAARLTMTRGLRMVRVPFLGVRLRAAGPMMAGKTRLRVDG
jgi:hypothetical protein